MTLPRSQKTQFGLVFSRPYMVLFQTRATPSASLTFGSCGRTSPKVLGSLVILKAIQTQLEIGTLTTMTSNQTELH